MSAIMPIRVPAFIFMIATPPRTAIRAGCQWAGLLALANQGRAVYGRPSLTGAQSVIYAVSPSDFHTITSGNNGYQAQAGYNLVTGRGTPFADRVVHDLLLVPGDKDYAAKT